MAEKITKSDPKDILAASLLGMNPSDAIEASEAAGQSQLVNSLELPKVVRGFQGDPDKALTDLGFIIGEVTDDLFRKTFLPKGWKKVATGHSMWSNIVDDKNRERFSIFYKAAFYDRDAFMNVNIRYHTTSRTYVKVKDELVIKDYQNPSHCLRGQEEWSSDCVIDSADGSVLFESPVFFYSFERGDEEARQKWIRESDESKELAKAWLQEHKPDWRNPTAYWD